MISTVLAAVSTAASGSSSGNGDAFRDGDTGKPGMVAWSVTAVDIISWCSIGSRWNESRWNERGEFDDFFSVVDQFGGRSVRPGILCGEFPRVPEAGSGARIERGRPQKGLRIYRRISPCL